MHRLILLGAPRIDGPGGPIGGPASGGRHVAVLALLAHAGAAGVPRERITALLWPESDAERARHSLEQVVYVLRRALGAEAVVSAGTALVLDGGLVASDLAEFVAAVERGDWERAVSLYAGPFLDAFHVSGALDFERWTDEVRAELHRRRAGALRHAAELQEAAGDPGDAVAAWRRLVAAEPLSAPAVLGLMRALAAAGDRSAALDVARAHGERLGEELDAAPDPEVARVAAELRGTGAGDAGAGGIATGASRPRDDGGGAASLDPPRRRGRRVAAPALVAVAGAVAVLLASTMGGAHSGAERGAGPEPRRDSTAPQRVVVLPFDAEPGDSIPATAGRMAGDWISQGLARTGLVEVVSATAAPHDVRVAGRVYRVGDSLWFQSWIAGGADGAVLRTMDAVHASAADPVPALEPLRQQVLGAIGTLYDPRLREWAGVALRPPRYEAYRAFARGVEAFSARDLGRALAEFRRSAAFDGGYAQPRLWGAWSCVMIGRFPCADSLVRSVAQSDGLSPLEQAWRDRIAAVLRGDNEASFRAARRMAELAPGSGWTMALHNAAMDTRRGRLALATLEGLGPEGLGLVGSYYWASVSRAHHMLGQHREALEVVDEGISAGSRHSETMVALAAALGAVGDTARLRAAIAEADALPGLSAEDRAAVVFSGAVELRAHGMADAARPLLREAAGRAVAAAERAPGDQAAVMIALVALHEAGRWEELASFIGRHPGAVPQVERLGAGGHAAARRGDRAAAAEADSALAALDEPFLFGGNTLWRARIAAGLGEAPRAVQLLRQAIGEGLSGVTWHSLHYGRDFDPLRGREDFREVMRVRG